MPLDNNPVQQPVRLPQWGAFRMAMLTNQAYQRISKASVDHRAVTRLESYFAIEADQWQTGAMFWRQILEGCPKESLPTVKEAEGWALLANQTNMPISFNPQGYMEFKQ
jgi:hypothetical protein